MERFKQILNSSLQRLCYKNCGGFIILCCMLGLLGNNSQVEDQMRFFERQQDIQNEQLEEQRRRSREDEIERRLDNIEEQDDV